MIDAPFFSFSLICPVSNTLPCETVPANSTGDPNFKCKKKGVKKTKQIKQDAIERTFIPVKEAGKLDAAKFV